MQWSRGHCDKDVLCFYRHPDEESGSAQNVEYRTPDFKRKRTFSNQNQQGSPSGSAENNFLYQKVRELSNQIEAQKYTIASSHQSHYSNKILPENITRQLPSQFPREQLYRPNLSEHADQFTRPSQSVQFSRGNLSDQVRNQTTPNLYTTPAGQAQPVPMPTWGLPTAQWVPQEFFQGNQTQ